MSAYKVVSRAVVPDCKRVVVGKFARALAEMIELPAGAAMQVPVKNCAEGANFVRQLRRIAAKERGIGEVMWNRSDDFKTYWFWLEERNPQ